MKNQTAVLAKMKNKLDKGMVQAIHAKLKKNLALMAEEEGLQIDIGKISWNENGFTAKITAKTSVGIQDEEDNNRLFFKMSAPQGASGYWFGARFEHKGEIYTIERALSGRLPIQARAGNRIVKAPVAWVRAALEKSSHLNGPEVLNG